MGYFYQDPVTNQMTDTPYQYTEAGIREKIDNYVPWEWRDIVCTCYVPGDSQHSVKCAHCDKLRRWLFRKCDECKEHFVMFGGSHHALRGEGNYNNYKFCYPCLVKKFGEKDGDNPYVVYKPRELMSTSEFSKMDFGDDDFGDFTV